MVIYSDGVVLAVGLDDGKRSEQKDGLNRGRRNEGVVYQVPGHALRHLYCHHVVADDVAPEDTLAGASRPHPQHVQPRTTRVVLVLPKPRAGLCERDGVRPFPPVSRSLSACDVIKLSTFMRSLCTSLKIAVTRCARGAAWAERTRACIACLEVRIDEARLGAHLAPGRVGERAAGPHGARMPWCRASAGCAAWLPAPAARVPLRRCSASRRWCCYCISQVQADLNCLNLLYILFIFIPCHFFDFSELLTFRSFNLHFRFHKYGNKLINSTTNHIIINYVLNFRTNSKII